MTTARRYPGSRPFQDNALDRLLFRGREQQKIALLHLILAEDLVLLYAKSGMGKTSLLNAGILEQLREKEYFPVMLRLNDPQRDLVISIQEQVREHASTRGVEVESGEQFQKHLWLFLYDLKLWQGDVLLTPVLIFDQFEELFTVNSEAQRQKFISHFADLACKHVPDTLRDIGGSGRLEKIPPLKMVLSIREDYLGEIELVAAEVPQVIYNRFRLTALTRDQAELAIREPATATDDRLPGQSFTYQPEAIGSMLDFLCTLRERKGLVQGNEVEPFQLQILCQHLEERVLERQQKGEGLVTVHPEDLGGQEGMEKILQDFYNHQITQLPEEDRDAVRRLCERGLINDSERRLSLEEEDIEHRFGVRKDLLVRMVELRLLRAEPRVGSVYYEISHDTLIAPVLRERKERDPETVFKMAEIHRVKGNFQEAFTAYERAIQLDGSYTFAYLQWANLLMEQGRADGAAEVLKRAVDHGVENETVYHLLGKALAKRGAYKEAIPYYWLFRNMISASIHGHFRPMPHESSSYSRA
jgi:tetratricopeptide (TPR) repeat protein